MICILHKNMRSHLPDPINNVPSIILFRKQHNTITEWLGKKLQSSIKATPMMDLFYEHAIIKGIISVTNGIYS